MNNPNIRREQRRDARTQSEVPVSIIIGTQLTVQGHLRDVSMKSAFIRMKNNIFIAVNDEIEFAIQCSQDKEDVVHGKGCIARIEKGEGFGIYFTEMDAQSEQKLKALIEK